MNTRVGPFGVEVIEGLRRLRVVLGPNEHGLSFDLSWEGTIPPQVEPQHFIRSQERVVFDSKRMAQTGRWTGSITADGERLEVTPDRWWGMVDAVGRFDYDGHTGYGPYEYWALGDHPSFR